MLKDPNYRPHGIKILVPKDKVTPTLESIVGSLIVSFDLVNLYSKDIVNVIDNPKKEKIFWKAILGKVIYKNNYTLSRLLKDMDEFLDVVKGYIDEIIYEKLKENNIIVNDFYELIFHIIDKFNHYVLIGEERSASIDTRYIDINYYILFELISGINKTLYSINKEYSRKKLTTKDINKIFNNHWSSRKIFNLIKNGVNIALNLVDYSGDNYYWKITSLLHDQNQGQGVKKHKDNAFPKSTRQIHAEDLIMGNVLYLSKKAPSPRFKINPFAKIDFTTGKFITDDVRDTLEVLNKLLEGKFEDNEILEAEVLEDIQDV
jgi:hypothetical protein